MKESDDIAATPLALTVSVSDSGGTLMQQALSGCDLDEARIEDAALKGAIWFCIRHSHNVRSRPARIRDLDIISEKPGELLININAGVLAQAPLQPQLRREEKNYSIWYKPAGMLCQGTRWGDHCSLARIVECEIQRPVHIVHRLDKAVSGLILVAHTRPAARALSACFANRQVDKVYRARVHGLVDFALPYCIDDPVDGKAALTTILAVDADEARQQSVVKITIDTGRKHQIRQHLSRIGFPIVGDRLFDPVREHREDLQLQAIELAFTCPFSGADIEVRCE